MILGLILARGGSKRCPGKNIRPLGGAPLIAWTITAAKYAEVDKILVSSDSDEILEVSRQWGADTLKRPDHLATDQTSSYPPILHALDSLEHPCEWLILLQPTSPFRVGPDITSCFIVAQWASREHMPAAISVEEGKNVPNGAVYIGRTDWLRDRIPKVERPFDDHEIAQYVMPPERSIDIDTEEDFARAEAIVESWAA